MNPVAFNIIGFEIRWYGILIAFAMLIGSFIAVRQCRKTGFDENYIIDLLLYCIPSALIGARLYYVIFQWENYKNNWLQILNIRNGGLAIHGGIIGAVIAALIYTRLKKISFLKVADICAPSLVLGQAIGRWGNFFNSEAFGGIVSSEFISHFPAFIQKGMFIDGAFHHPTFLYESIWDLAVFVFLIFYRRKERKDGYIFSLYLILYSIGRFCIEGLRLDSLMAGGLRAAQLASIIMILAGILLMVYSKLFNHNE